MPVGVADRLSHAHLTCSPSSYSLSLWNRTASLTPLSIVKYTWGGKLQKGPSITHHPTALAPDMQPCEAPHTCVALHAPSTPPACAAVWHGLVAESSKWRVGVRTTVGEKWGVFDSIRIAGVANHNQATPCRAGLRFCLSHVGLKA